jgi:hypothetical protein
MSLESHNLAISLQEATEQCSNVESSNLRSEVGGRIDPKLVLRARAWRWLRAEFVGSRHVS